jgi:hypothetical protein
MNINARVHGLILLATLPVLACFTEFPNPLGPVREAFIDPRLLGRWTCLGTESSVPGEMTVMDFDGRQYLVSLEGGGEKPSQNRAYTTRINDATFWNVQSLGPRRESDWSFVQYSFPEEGHLQLQMIHSDVFDDVRSDASEVRRLIEENLENAEFFEPLLDCTPVPESTDAG